MTDDEMVSGMNGVEEAKQAFLNAGLPFPKIPEELAVRLEKRGKWIFSTRKIDVYPLYP
jgi:hypothetical protein